MKPRVLLRLPRSGNVVATVAGAAAGVAVAWVLVVCALAGAVLAGRAAAALVRWVW